MGLQNLTLIISQTKPTTDLLQHMEVPCLWKEMCHIMNEIVGTQMHFPFFGH